MNTSKPYLKAIAANLEALWSILDTAMRDIGHGLEAAGQGNQNGAVGSIIPVEEQLRQASILVQAIIILHRQNSGVTPMTYATASINPHYAARLRRAASLPGRSRQPKRQDEPQQPIYARLPRAPITGSPVPHLTSLYHFHRAGEYGDRKLARQLRRQPDQGPAHLLPPRPGVRPDDAAAAPPATCARNSASRAWPGTSTRVSTPATRRISRRRRRSISSGHTRPTGG